MDIDIATGAVAVIISEFDDDGNVVQEHDDTPANFERIGTVAVRDAIVKRLREAETRQAYNAYSEYEGRVVSGVVHRHFRDEVSLLTSCTIRNNRPLEILVKMQLI